MRYIPLTNSDRSEMLAVIGVKNTEALFASIPSEVRHKGELKIPTEKTEFELRSYFEKLALKNPSAMDSSWTSFMGGGAYEHFIPTLVDALSSRGEFATAYTPYQPEVSQGTLQAIFEFQSLIANLFSMEVANASMYDGASSLAEAVLMTLRLREDATQVWISKGVHPEYLQVVRSYLGDTGIKIVELEVDASGRTVLPPLTKDVATVVIQQPNFFGVVESLDRISKTVHEAGALFTVATTEAMAFGILQGPGAHGADIVAGEGQSFGNPLSFGGPYVGLFATKMEHIRQMPGRLVGKTVDQTGRPAYCLTLSTREQHIKRERATSNICTNHSLCALRACIYLATVGEKGLREISKRNLWAAGRLKKKLAEIKGIEFPYDGPIFNEFVVRLPISTDAFLNSMEKAKVLGGIPLSKWDAKRERDLLITVTETKTQEQIARFVEAARKAL